MKFAAVATATGYVVDIPCITQTEKNCNENWRTRHGRSKAQRAVTALALDLLHNPADKIRIKRIRFVRFGVGELDLGDNLNSSFSHIRDQVVAWIAGDNTITGKGSDGVHCGITWEYDHVKQNAYGVRVEMRFGT